MYIHGLPNAQPRNLFFVIFKADEDFLAALHGAAHDFFGKGEFNGVARSGFCIQELQGQRHHGIFSL